MFRFIFGSFLVIFGISLFADQFTVLNLIGINFQSIMSLFWLILGIVLMMKRHNFWGIVLIFVGICGFLSGVFHLDLGAIFIPVIFVAWGISLLFKKEDSISFGKNVSGKSEADSFRENVIFSSLERRYNSQNFQGGKIDVAFGGFKLDLTNVKLAKEGAVIDINAAFGGGEIIVPDNMNIVSEGSGILGGWEEKYTTRAEKDSPKLVLRGTAVFGGVEIKN